MTGTRFARAGLALGLALLLFLPAQAEEAARRRWIPGVPDVQKALAEGNRDQALAWIDEIAAESPTGSTTDRLVPLQNLLLQVGDDAARSRLDSWISSGLANEEAAAFMKARMEPSRRAFEEVLARFPAHRFAKRALAVVDADEGRWPEARKQFERVLAENSSDPAFVTDTRHRMASAAYQAGDLDFALEQWGIAVETDSGFADAWHGLGTAWLGRGVWSSAETALRRAIAADPSHWKARIALCQALAAQGRFSDVAPLRELLRARAKALKGIPDAIKVAVLPRGDGATVVRESLREQAGYILRVEHFDQARGGGKPIRIMELRRKDAGCALGEVDAEGRFTEKKTWAEIPDLPTLLRED